MSKILKILGISFIALIAIIILLPFGTISAGERGIRLRFGAVSGDLIHEGLYFRVPIMESIVVMDIKIQKEQVDATAASKDLQTVNTTVAVNFHLDSEKVGSIYSEIGTDYKSRLIDPALQESVKASTAKYTAEELITKRELVRDDIKQHLSDKLNPRGIIVDDFNIVNFDFSPSFNQAIEAKVTAEQSALAAKNKLEQIKFEAEQNIAEAKGKAEALRVESEALKSNLQIIQLRAIEKWDGVLPRVTGGATPLIDVKTITQ